MAPTIRWCFCILLFLLIPVVRAYRYCPPNWLEFALTCVTVNPQPLTWQEADDACSQMAPGARLGTGCSMPLLEIHTTPGKKWIGFFLYLGRGWTFVDGYSINTWKPPHYSNSLPYQNCGIFDTAIRNFTHDNCSLKLPSFCQFGSDSESLCASFAASFPFNRLYGARDLSRETSNRGKSWSLIKTAVMKNVVTTTGPSGKPGTAIRFLPELDSSIRIDDPTESKNMQTLESNAYWAFYFLPQVNQSGTIFSFLSRNYSDGKGVNVRYDGVNNNIIIDVRAFSFILNETLIAPSNCTTPGVWQYMVFYVMSTWIHIFTTRVGLCVSLWAPISIGNYATGQGIVIGQDPVTKATWNGSISGFQMFTSFSTDYPEYKFMMDSYINVTTLETRVDDDVVQRLPTNIPLEYNLVGFWPMTDYYTTKEGSGKIYEFINYSTPLSMNPWLRRNVYNGTGRHEFFSCTGSRDVASLALYQTSFTIVVHISKRKGEPDYGTSGPLIEYRNGNSPTQSGLTLWMLVNGTLMVLATPSPANGMTTFTASFPNCYPSTTSAPMGLTYRLSLVYSYENGTMAAWANNELCGGSVQQVGQRNFDTLAGFRVGHSMIVDPLNISNTLGSPQSFVSGQIFCLFIYDTADLKSDQLETLSELCYKTSALTPLYSGPNNLLYKAANLRAFWPLGRDLGATDISGRNHHGDSYRMASSTGPTGLPYSAALFHGKTGNADNYHISFGRAEYYYTLGTNNSITYAFWYHFPCHSTGAVTVGALFGHGNFSQMSGPTSAATSLSILEDGYTIRFTVYGHSAVKWSIDFTLPVRVINRWIWTVVQINRADNYLYMNVDGYEKNVTVANTMITTSTFVTLGHNLGNQRLRGGRMSCFMIYDYAVATWEFPILQAMCNSTLQHYYGKYAGLFSYPQSLGLFWPLTQRFLAQDISGRNQHGALGYGKESISYVQWVMGPTNVTGTAAYFSTLMPTRPAIQRAFLSNNEVFGTYDMAGSIASGGISAGMAATALTVSFYYTHANDNYARHFMYNKDRSASYSLISGRIYFNVQSAVSLNFFSSCEIPAGRYVAGQWVFFTAVSRAVTAPCCSMNIMIFLDTIHLCNFTTFTGSTLTNVIPILKNDIMLGRDFSNSLDGNMSMACFTIINEVADPSVVKADCDRILSGRYDDLIVGNVKPTTLFPLSAQTEGDNTVGTPHGYFMDVDFSSPNAVGLPRASMTMTGIDSQYFVAEQSSSGFPLNLINRTVALTVLYNANIRSSALSTSTAEIVFGYTGTYGLIGSCMNTSATSAALYSLRPDIGNLNRTFTSRSIFQPDQWNVYGFHYDAIADNVYNTINGISSDVYMEHILGNVYSNDGSLILGIHPTIPLSFATTKMPFIGSMSCFQMYDRGLNLAELSKAARWCANPDYIGCFPFDASKTISKAMILDRVGMTATKCRNFCASMGQRFAAIERGYMCRCLDGIPPGTIEVLCKKTASGNLIEEGGAALGAVSLYTSALTRRIFQFSITRVVPFSCPPGWIQIPSLYFYCYHYTYKLDDFYAVAAMCRQPAYGYQSVLIFPEEQTEDTALELLRSKCGNVLQLGVCWAWMGYYGGASYDSTPMRLDGKRFVSYFMYGSFGTYYALSKEPSSKPYWETRWPTSYASLGVCKTRSPPLDVCPWGTTRIFNACYLFVSANKTFEDAEYYCQQNATGGHLATIYNFAQQRLILNTSFCDHQTSFWIGAKFSGPGNWSWLGYNNQSNYNYWALDFSPNDMDMTAPCVYADARSMYQWRTASCQRLYSFVCEFPANYRSFALNSGNGALNNYSITSSAPNSIPYAARIYNDSGYPEPPCWCGRSAMNGSEYIQVDYANLVLVNSVRIEGCANLSAYVTQYMVNYSSDGLNWTTYLWTDASYELGFSGVISQVSATLSPNVLPSLAGANLTQGVRHIFQTPFVARYVRIIPTDFITSMCLRFALIADIVDPMLPDIRANTFSPLYIDTFRDAGMGVFYRLYVYRLGFTPMPQLYSVSDVIRTGEMAYTPRLIGSQKLVLVATDAEGYETETSVLLQLETRTRSMYISSCPPTSEGATLVKCFVQIVGGSNYTMTTSYGTQGQPGYRQYVTRVIAPRHEYGLLAPKANSTGAYYLFNSSSSWSNRTYLAVNFPFESTTTVHAVEADLTVGGRIFVSFYQPDCPTETPFCMQSYSCLASNLVCKLQPAYDGYICPTDYDKCQDRAGCCSRIVDPPWLPPNRNYFPGPSAPISYSLIREMEIWFPGIGPQIYYFTPDELQELPPGTVMGLRFPGSSYGTGEVKLASTNVTTFSVPGGASPRNILASSTTAHDLAPMMRAITVDSTTFGLYTYWLGNCGTVPFAARLVDANWPDNFFSVSQDITVASGCQQPTLAKPGILYAQTPIPIELVRTYNCFCNYEITWSDTNGTQALTWDPAVNSVEILHTFRDVGRYLMDIHTWNHRNDSTFTYTFYVTAGVSTMTVQVQNQPALPFGQQQAFNFISFAGPANNDSKALVNSNVALTLGDASNVLMPLRLSAELVNGSSCLTGWVQQPSGMCLLFVNKTLTFGDAEFYCNSLDASLAYAPASQTVTLTALSNLAANRSATTFWMGLTRLRNRNNFWVPTSNDDGAIDGIDQLTGTTPGSDCVSYSRTKPGLVAQPCSTQMMFICQRPTPTYKMCSYNGEQWFSYGSRCFQSFPYWNYTFATASLECKKLGGALAAPRDASEIAGIAGIISLTLNTTPSHFYISGWRGGASGAMVPDLWGNVHRLVANGTFDCFKLSTSSSQVVTTPCSAFLPAICERPFSVGTKPRRYFNRLANRRLITEGYKDLSCPIDWKQSGDFCYRLISTSLSQQAASEACIQQHSAKLAAIHNEADNNIVKSLISDVGASAAWIGVVATSNSWLWQDGSGALDSAGYTNWIEASSPQVSNGVAMFASGGWNAANSATSYPCVCMKKPCSFAYGRKFSGNCQTSAMFDINGTCYTQPTDSNITTFEQASDWCLNTNGGTLVAPSTLEEWQMAMSTVLQLSTNAAWTGFVISSSSVVMLSNTTGVAPFFNGVPDLSQTGCLAIYADEGLKVVNCSTQLPYWCESPAVACPIGWTVWGGSCYKASEVDTQSSGVGTSSDIAYNFCQLLGAYPASVASEKELAVLPQLAPTSNVLVGQAIAARGTLSDAAGRLIYNPSPPSNSQAARVYFTSSQVSQSVTSTNVTAQAICQRPSLLTPDDCALACMTSSDPICNTFEYHGDYCILLSDIITKYSYGLRNANGASDLYSVESATAHCSVSFLSTLNDVQYIGNDSIGSPSDVILGAKLKGFIPINDTKDILEIEFSAISSLYGFKIATNNSALGYVTSLRLDCTTGIIDPFANCFPSLGNFPVSPASGVFQVEFPRMITVRRIRIVPITWVTKATYQLEFMGCHAIAGISHSPGYAHPTVGTFVNALSANNVAIGNLTTCAQIPASGLSLKLPAALKSDQNASGTVIYASGSEVTVNASFANISLAVNLNTTLQTASFALPLNLFDQANSSNGHYLVAVTIDNAVSDPVYVDSSVCLEVPVTELTVASNQTKEYGTLRNDPVQFFVTASNCTRCMLNVTFHTANGQANYSLFFELFHGKFSDIFFAWDIVGRYSVEFFMFNNVSNMSASLSVAVENPARNFYFTVSSPNVIPYKGNATVKMVFTYDGPAVEYPKFPSHPVYQVEYWDGQVAVGEFSADVPSSGIFQANVSSLSRVWDKRGSYEMTVVIENNVTIYNYTQQFQVDFFENLSTLTLTNVGTSYVVSTLDSANVNLTIAWGVPWEFRLVTSTTDLAWLNDVNKTNDLGWVDAGANYTIPYSLHYKTPGVYYVVAYARNAVGSLGPVRIDTPIKFETPIFQNAYSFSAEPTFGQLAPISEGSSVYETDTINMTLWYNTSVDMASDVSTTIDFGDGRILDDGILACDPAVAEVVRGRLNACRIYAIIYHAAGSLTIKVTLRNDISDQNFLTVFPVYFAAPKKLYILYQFRYNSTSQWQAPLGTKQNYVPSNTEVLLYSTAPKSAVYQVCWEFGDGEKSDCPEEFTMTPLNITYVYAKDSPCGAFLESCGFYVFMNASNPVGYAEAEKALYVQHRTVNPYITESGPGAINVLLRIDIAYDQLGTDACILIDFGTNDIAGARQILRGSEYMCASFYDIEHLRTLKALTVDELNMKRIMVSANYTRKGRYAIKVAIRNMVETLDWQTNPKTLSKQVLITGGACGVPITSVQAVPFNLRSQPLVISASALHNCTSSHTMTQNWTVEFATSENATLWKNMTLTYVPKDLRRNVFVEDPAGSLMRDLSLSFPKKSLPIGFYRFTLQLDQPEEDSLNVTAIFVTEIRRGPLIAKFNPSTTYVDGAFGDNYTIDASTLSYDPDTDELTNSTANLQVAYYCKRACEGPWPSFDTYDKVAAFVADPQSWTPTACAAEDAELEVIGIGKPGCFFYGLHAEPDPQYAAKDLAPSINLPSFVREFDFPDENGTGIPMNVTLYEQIEATKGVMLQTGNMFLNQTFSLLAIVTDPETRRFQFLVQFLRLESDRAPNGIIKQLSNCGYSYKLGCLMNPTSRMTLRRTIENKVKGGLYRYKWTFVPVPPEAVVEEYLDHLGNAMANGTGVTSFETMSNWTSMTTTGRKGPDLSFKAGAFKTSGGVYIIISEASLAGGGRIGRTMLVVYVDNPPNATLASCPVDPVVGTAMVTPFSIQCSGFTDVDDPVLKKFMFVAYTCASCDPIYLTPIPQAGPQLRSLLLPSGDPSNNYIVIIRTYCYDSVDAVAIVDNYTAKVYPQGGLDYIQAQYTKLTKSAPKSTPDLLVTQLIGFVNVLNSYTVPAPYDGNWTLINSALTNKKDRQDELSKITKDFDRYSSEMLTLRNIRLTLFQWIRTAGVSTASIQSIKSYCALLSTMEAVPAQMVSLEIQQLTLSCVQSAVNLLSNYSVDITVDAADIESASSSCVNTLGKFSEILEFLGKFVELQNPVLTTTTTTDAAILDDTGGAVQVTPTTVPQVLELTSQLTTLKEQLMDIILSRKGVQEGRSVIGGTSSKMSLSADFVGNLDNANLASGGDEDCGNFQLGDAKSTFGPSIGASMAKQGLSMENNTDEFTTAKIQLKAAMDSGNVHSAVQSGDYSLNSMIQSLTMVDENGKEVAVKNLPSYIEIMVESRSSAKPNALLTASLGYEAARKMQPIKSPVSRDSAVFVTVEQVFDLATTSLAGSAKCNMTTDVNCENPYGNLTLQVGTRNLTIDTLNATDEEVVIFVFLNREGMYPKESSILPNLGCILPRDRIEDELWYIRHLGNITTTTVSTRTPLLTTTTGRFKRTTTPTTTTTTTQAPSQTGSQTGQQIIGAAKKQCTKNKVLPSNLCFFGNDVVNVTNSSMNLYIGVRAIPMRLLKPLLQQLYSEYKMTLNESIIINKTMDILLTQAVTAYIKFQSYSASCIFWDPDRNDWSTEGCYVGPLSTAGGNPSLTQCFCNHLTTFASNFDVPMNTFNPNDSAFTHLDENPICFTFGICIFGLYFTVLIWARRKDREDERMWGCLPLIDNDPRDKYAYEITVWTGQRSGSGTTARVSFILVGDEGETQPRMLDDVERPILQRGQVDSFLMTVPRSLGRLNQLHIWHDNSGKHPAWYLARMMILDIQRSQQYFFICDQWFAVEKDDGMVERSLPVADKTQLSGFEYMFATRTQRKLTDGHMWISVFSRPPRSAFTRTQRLTCCLSVLYCTMLSNIMFFGINKDPPDSIKFQLGPIGISADKIKISIVSALIVMPMNLLIVQLFRMSKRKLTHAEQKMENMVAAAEKKRKEEEIVLQRRQSSNPDDTVAMVLGVYAKAMTKTVHKKKKAKSKKKPYKLPWWCTIVAYCLAVATCGVAFWAIVEYGGSLGPERAQEWVVSMVLSLFTDILLLQPAKIIILVLFYTLVIKNPTQDEDVEEHMLLKEDEEFLRPRQLNKVERAEIEKNRKELEARNKDYVYLPPDPEVLKQARDHRLKEIATWKVIKEVASYVFFVLMVMFVAYNNVDAWAWQMQKSTRAVFYGGVISDLSSPPFNTTLDAEAIAAGGTGSIYDVTDAGQVWFYLNHTLLPSLLDRAWYNGVPDRQKGSFAKDQVNYLAGIIRLRQLRAKPGTCRVSKPFRKIIFNCFSEYSLFNQDTRNYTHGWEHVKESNDLNDTDGPGWSYFSTFKTGSLPSQGVIAAYDGGGYVVLLPKDLTAAREMIADLHQSKWLDGNTRALFVEFNLYNPSRSLFAISQNIFEMPATGGVRLFPFFYILKMQTYSSAGEMVTLGLQAATLMVVIVLFTRECFRARHLGRKYWKDFWSVLDFCHFLACILWAGMFGGRFLAFKAVSGGFRKRANAYTNLDLIATYDVVVSGFSAIIVTVGTLRFVRLLRFSRSVMTMLATLRIARPYLVSFSVLFFTIFLAFAQFGYLIFYAELKAYSSFVFSLETLFAMQLGVFDFVALRNNFSIVGPLYFIIFSVLVSILMTNFIVAFIVAAYEDVTHDVNLMKEEKEVLAFLADKFKKAFGLVERRPKTLSVDKKFMYLADEPDDDEIDRFTSRMEELMTKVDEHLEKTKRQFSAMFDKRVLKQTYGHAYVTE